MSSVRPVPKTPGGRCSSGPQAHQCFLDAKGQGCPGPIWQGLSPPGHHNGSAGLTLSGEVEGEGYLHHQRASKCQWSSCPAGSGRWCSPAAHWPRWWGPLLGQEGPGVSKGHHWPQIKGITPSWFQPCSPSVLETPTLPAK